MRKVYTAHRLRPNLCASLCCGRRRQCLANQLLQLLLAQQFAVTQLLRQVAKHVKVLHRLRVDVDAAEEPTPALGRDVPGQLLVLVLDNADQSALLAADDVVVEGDVAGYQGEEGVVLAAANVLARPELGPSLPDEDVAGDDGLACRASESALPAEGASDRATHLRTA